MKVEIIKRCSVICEPGSIVEVTESQYKALGGFFKPIEDKKPIAEKTETVSKKPTPKGGKKKEV